MTPEPVSPPLPVFTVIDTTLGDTAAATLARFSVGDPEPPTLTGAAEVTTVFEVSVPAPSSPVTPLPTATAISSPPAATRSASPAASSVGAPGWNGGGWSGGDPSGAVLSDGG